MARRLKSRWLRLTDEEIARVRLLLSRDSDRLITEAYDHDDPEQSSSQFASIWINQYVIDKIDGLYKNRK